ncbi:MAG: LamG domain-containing protein [Verrucomicrobiaceae bacterium]|nr:LamG domain-containing protein [Verrucomicrobiaceae bacterium]
MNGKLEKFVELEKLLSSLHDSTASREDTARIETLLRGDPEACEFYLDYSQMCAETDLEYSAQNAIEIGRKTVPLSLSKTTALFWRGKTTKQILNPSWKPLPWFAAAAGLMLIAGSIAFFSGNDNPLATSQLKATESAETAIDNGVAILMGSVDASFGNGAFEPLKNGGILPLGELRLESGIVEIEFYSGTRMILEGPSILALTSENSGTLVEGRIRVHVPKQANGFSLRTSQLEIMNPIGELGVSIVEDGHLTEIHCFDGITGIHELSEHKNAKSLRSLNSGEAISFQANGARKIDANSMAFVSYADIAYSSLETSTLRHNKWSHLIERMRADATILALYTFEDQGPRERRLVNQAAYKEMFTHGAIIGCRWTKGRWPSKGSLEFSRASDRVRINYQGSHQVLTFSTWVRLDAPPRKHLVSLLSSHSRKIGAFDWTIQRDGRIRFSIRANDKNKIHHYNSPVVFTANSINKWHHLVTIYDTVQKSVKHFLAGKEISKLRAWGQEQNPPNEKNALPVTFGDLEIGNFAGKLPNGKRPVRNLTGRIDELAIFGRALDTNEVFEIFNTGRPK